MIDYGSATPNDDDSPSRFRHQQWHPPTCDRCATAEAERDAATHRMGLALDDAAAAHKLTRTTSAMLATAEAERDELLAANNAPSIIRLARERDAALARVAELESETAIWRNQL